MADASTEDTIVASNIWLLYLARLAWKQRTAKDLVGAPGGFEKT